ncbi:MAG: TIGR00730 family Rossman fold protein [Bacteroidota bacterium]
MARSILSRADKSYKDLPFLNSPDARSLRILSEFLHPHSRFRRVGIKDTVVFFGSARLSSRAAARKAERAARKAAEARRTKKNLTRLEDASVDLEMSGYYEDAVALARKMTDWSKRLFHSNRFVVCSGGGPGIMEAANRGAKLARGRSIGLNISLPFEQNPNPFISPELNFEFHYFFMRKFWFVYLAKAFVMFPGGFGTFDELMEVLTLLQTAKIKKPVVVVLYGREFWNSVIRFDELVRRRLISKKDLNLFEFADTPDEAYKLLTKRLRALYPKETEEQQVT